MNGYNKHAAVQPRPLLYRVCTGGNQTMKLPDEHPLARAMKEAMRTMSPVTLTQDEAMAVYRELADLHDRREAQQSRPQWHPYYRW